jgi:hypothetical protein
MSKSQARFRNNCRIYQWSNSNSCCSSNSWKRRNRNSQLCRTCKACFRISQLSFMRNIESSWMSSRKRSTQALSCSSNWWPLLTHLLSMYWKNWSRERKKRKLRNHGCLRSRYSKNRLDHQLIKILWRKLLKRCSKSTSSAAIPISKSKAMSIPMTNLFRLRIYSQRITSFRQLQWT